MSIAQLGTDYLSIVKEKRGRCCLINRGDRLVVKKATTVIRDQDDVYHIEKTTSIISNNDGMDLV
jgi:hypothetical protein